LAVWLYFISILQRTMMIVAKATKSCRLLIIHVKAYFTGAHLLVHYISVNNLSIYLVLCFT